MALPNESEVAEVVVESKVLNGGLVEEEGAWGELVTLAPLAVGLIRGTVRELILPLLFMV